MRPLQLARGFGGTQNLLQREQPYDDGEAMIRGTARRTSGGCADISLVRVARPAAKSLY